MEIRYCLYALNHWSITSPLSVFVYVVFWCVFVTFEWSLVTSKLFRVELWYFVSLTLNIVFLGNKVLILWLFSKWTSILSLVNCCQICLVSSFKMWKNKQIFVKNKWLTFFCDLRVFCVSGPDGLSD